MKKKVYIAVALGAILALSGCGTTTSSQTSTSTSQTSTSTSSQTSTATSETSSTTSQTNSSSSQTVESSESTTSTSVSVPEPVKLATPTLALNNDETGLSWNEVSGASSYQVKVNDGAYAAATSYAFSSEVNTYVVKVQALGDGVNYTNSDEAVWNYETKAVALGDLAVTGLTVSWANAVANGIQAGYASDGNITTWADVTGDSYTATANGKVGIVAKNGYDQTNNINYAGEKITKYIWAINDATSDKVLMDESTDFADDVKIQTYLTSAWEDAGAHAAITVEKADVEEAFNSAKFKIQQLSNAYKFSTAVSGLDAYYGLSLNVKGDGKTAVFLQMSGPQGWASYSIGVLNNNWHALTIPLAGAGWKVNDTSATLSDAASAANYPSAAALMNSFTEVSLVFKTVADAGYAYTNIYLHDFTLVAGDAGKTLVNEESVDFVGTYTGVNNDGTIFKLVRTDPNTDAVSFATLNLANNLAGNATLALVGNELTITMDLGGNSTVYVGTLSDTGRLLSFVSATGALAAYLQQVNFNHVYTVDNFDAYPETGVGYDGNNQDPTKLSGLRSVYYGEYYTGSGVGTSLLGDKNWQMMGSTDYLNLVTTEGHSGAQCAAFKRSANSMRFTTAAMARGNAAPLPHGDKFSFWAKGVSADVTLKVQLFTSQSALYWDAMVALTIPANSPWTQYTVDMSATTTYYGFGFLFSGSAPTVYPEVDDIEIYTAGNPWASYVDHSPILPGTLMVGSTAALPSVTATFGQASSVSIAALDAGSATHNLAGVYTFDANTNTITMDCGADLNYVGTLSPNKTAIKYVSATGNLATYVANLFLETSIAGQTRIEGFENTTTEALVAKYTYAKGAAPTDLESSAGYVESSDAASDSGFSSMKVKIDWDIASNSAFYGKARVFCKSANAYGSFTHLSYRMKNETGLALTGVFVTGVINSSGSRSVLLSTTATADAQWTTFTATMASATALYGWSFYAQTATTTTSGSGYVYIDNVFVW